MTALHIKDELMTRNKISYLFALSMVLYLIHPMYGIITAFFVLFAGTSIYDKEIDLIFVMIALFFALLNTTRVYESDLLNYKIVFDNAGSMKFSEYIAGYNREIVYYAANYVLNPLLFGNFKLYIILITMVQYLLRFSALRMIMEKSEYKIMIFAVLMSLLEPRSFFSSVHLLRQMLSASMFMYFLAYMYSKKKILWWMIPIAVLIHSSSLILFIIAFIPKLNSKINIKLLSIIAFLFMIMLFFGDNILGFLSRLTSPISWLNYPFARMQDIESSNYGWYEGTGNYVNLLRYVALPTIFFIYLRKEKEDCNYAVNFILIYYILLEFWRISGLYYLQMRMTMYLYPFSGIALALMVRGIKDRFGKTIAVTAAVVMIAFFSYRFARSLIGEGSFQMIRLDEILIRPFVQYIYELF